MKGLLLWLARLAGLMGVLLCVVSVAGRLTGIWFMGDFFQSHFESLFQIGMAGMVLGCLSYLVALMEFHRK
jgi:hypothetical protein